MKYQSKKRVKLLEERYIAFCEFTLMNKRTPTVRECVILWGFAPSATSAAQNVLLKLVDQDWLTATKSRSRSRYQITGMLIKLPQLYFTLKAKHNPQVELNEGSTSPTHPTSS